MEYGIMPTYLYTTDFDFGLFSSSDSELSTIVLAFALELTFLLLDDCEAMDDRRGDMLLCNTTTICRICSFNQKHSNRLKINNIINT